MITVYAVTQELPKALLAEVGYVVRSREFACGYLDPDGVVFIDGESRDTDIAARFETRPPRIAKGAYDETRGDALFVVEAAREIPVEPHVPAWYIEARRLRGDRSYDPNGEQIRFFQRGPADHVIPEVDLVGRMEKR